MADYGDWLPTLFGRLSLLLQEPRQPEQGAPLAYGVPMRAWKFPLKEEKKYVY